ncbi:MAG: DNA-directed RNA polymerase subunit omega [Bacteroidetes bacterium]|nr:MAG: DNA-directed RNA polymerase subunit omega [Bacteroidota bacterium]TAG86904.1 MAG: DNA-directed RNA polymerase subunit omega [Bacteroidota bacterium]
MAKYRVTSVPSIIPRDIKKLSEQTGNLYASVSIISRRAAQISSKIKEELVEKLNDFSSTVDSFEEIHENREQIEISRYYEKLPKPTSVATDEFLEYKLKFGFKEE